MPARFFSLLALCGFFACQPADQPARKSEKDSFHEQDTLTPAGQTAARSDTLLPQKTTRPGYEWKLWKDDTLWLTRTPLGEDVIIRAFFLREGKMRKVLQDTAWGEAYRGDRLEDVDFDGFPDYVFRSYSPNGCCPRDVSHICRYNPLKRRFQNQAYVMNAAVDPKTKTIYSMEYGRPESLSAFRWQGDSLFAYETIYWENQFPDSGETRGRMLRSRHPFRHAEAIDSLPAGYKKIYMIEWFLH